VRNCCINMNLSGAAAGQCYGDILISASSDVFLEPLVLFVVLGIKAFPKKIVQKRMNKQYQAKLVKYERLGPIFILETSVKLSVLSICA